MKRTSLVILLFVVSFINLSCQKKQVKRFPIVLESWLSYNQWRCQRLIIGSDSQEVDSLYQYYNPHDSLPESRSWYHVKKYYVSIELQELINESIANHCLNSVNCDSINMVTSSDHFYRFNGYNTTGDILSCCLTCEEDAVSFYTDLKKAIIDSKYDNSRRDLLLSDLRSLVVIRIFSPPVEVEKKAKENLTRQEWASYIDRKQMEDDKIKNEINKIRDSANK